MDFLPFRVMKVPWKIRVSSGGSFLDRYLAGKLERSEKKIEPELMNNNEICTTHILCNLYNQSFNVVMYISLFPLPKQTIISSVFVVPLHLLNISSRTTWYAHVVGPIPAVHNFWQSVKRRLRIYNININVFHPTKWAI